MGRDSAVLTARWMAGLTTEWPELMSSTVLGNLKGPACVGQESGTRGVPVVHMGMYHVRDRDGHLTDMV